MSTKYKTKEQRAAYYAGGRATVGTVGQFDRAKHEFYTSHVGKVRGTIITDADGRWKFTNSAEALAAARWFLQHCKKTAEQTATR